MALGAAAWIALALAGVQPFRRRLGPGLAWWAATAAMVDWHLGMVETADGRPRSLSSPPTHSRWDAPGSSRSRPTPPRPP